MLKTLLAKLFGRPASAAPNAEDLLRDQVSNNEAVREQLRSNGDDGSQPREVSHFAYPVSGKEFAEAKVVADALIHDFGMSVKATAADGGLAFDHVAAVASQEFDILTTRLSLRLAASGWTYDGWGCAVANNSGEAK
jgi:hypothetical protein